MPQLAIEQPGVPPLTVPLTPGQEVKLGRAEDNTVILVADEVSRHHARLAPHGKGFLLIDLKSLNGTYVNRQRIVERVLSHLDEIWLGGKCRIVYRDERVSDSVRMHHDDDETLQRQQPPPVRGPAAPPLHRPNAPTARPPAVATPGAPIRISIPAPQTPIAGPGPKGPMTPVERAAAAARPAGPMTPAERAAAMRQEPLGETMVRPNLDKIREELEQAGASMTMIAKTGDSAIISGKKLEKGPSSEEIVTMGRAYRRLSALYQASKLIAGDFDLDRRLAAVLDTAIEVMEAERGFLILHNEQTGALEVRVAREMGRELTASSPSMGIAGKAALDGEPVLMASATDDSEFGARESIIMQRIASAMCVPLKIEQRILGSIYVDTRKTDREFKEDDLELFASLAAQLAMAIENVRLYERMVEAEKKRADLGRFLSPAIVEQIMRGGASLELGGTKRTVTTVFCDVRGFTPIAERTEASLLVDMLNDHFTAMTGIIFQYQGTLDKYIGDEIMAVFGSPISAPDDAYRAACACLDIQALNHELNQKRQSAGLPLFELGIGMTSGEAVAGYVGSPDRMEFTVVGDRINTARRLCGVAQPGQIICDQATYEAVCPWIEGRSIGKQTVKGKEEAVEAYELIRRKAQ